MKILVDSREQLPFTFAGYNMEIEPGALPCGDYSLPGFEDRVAVERKTLDDLIGCLSHDRQRFEKELAKGRVYESFIVVVEGSFQDLRSGKYRSQMNPHAAAQSVIAFQNRYRIPFVWCGDRPGAEYIVYWTLQKYLAEIEKRFERLAKTQPGGGMFPARHNGHERNRA